MMREEVVISLPVTKLTQKNLYIRLFPAKGAWRTYTRGEICRGTRVTRRSLRSRRPRITLKRQKGDREGGCLTQLESIQACIDSTIMYLLFTELGCYITLTYVLDILLVQGCLVFHRSHLDPDEHNYGKSLNIQVLC